MFTFSLVTVVVACLDLGMDLGCCCDVVLCIRISFSFFVVFILYYRARSTLFRRNLQCLYAQSARYVDDRDSEFTVYSILVMKLEALNFGDSSACARAFGVASTAPTGHKICVNIMLCERGLVYYLQRYPSQDLGQ